MMCDRCHEQILEGEAYETVDIVRPTGPGMSVVLHKGPCEKAPHQSAPVSRGRRRTT